MENISPFTRVRNEANLVEIFRKPEAILQKEDAIYLGYAWIGTEEIDTPFWLIERLSINPDNGMILRMYPDGNKKQCIYKFSECTTYNYQFVK